MIRPTTLARSHARVCKRFMDLRGTRWINGYDGLRVTSRDGKFTFKIRNLRFSEGELTLVASTTSQRVFLTGRENLLRLLRLFANNLNTL